MESIKDSLETLKKAQQIDQELYQSKMRLAVIPHERQALRREMEKEKGRLAELQDVVKKLQLKQKEKELDLGKKEDNIKKLDGQLSQVKTNKEYSALQQEIASLKADNSLLEEDIIKILDEVESAEEEVQKEKETLKEVEKKYKEKEDVLSRDEKECQGKLDRLQQARDEALKDLPLELRSRYELIIKKKQGLALAKVQGEMCTACQMQLRPQLMNEVQMGLLVVCETCSRILYQD